MRRCKEGNSGLEDIINSERLMRDFQPEECMRRTGIRFFSNEELKQNVIETAAKESFTTECQLNSQSNRDWICDLKCQALSDEKISERIGISDVNEVG